ncbi:MAG: bifunctional 4-hydroxy-2-oxoglutarate aldolase/2-dehydro-3-deoxy-phosphogluconate aldolase [Lysobacterales bacterium]
MSWTVAERSAAADAVLTRAPVLPVLAIEHLEDAVPLARALVDGGLPVLEVTLRTAAALPAIAAIAAAVPQARVGAGTVLDADQLDAVARAGGAFAIAPGCTPTLYAAAARSPLPFLPAVASASEIMQGLEQGHRRFKFFPAAAAGGVAALKAFAGPFADVRFCPTGGIDAASARDYLALPNVLTVGGSWMVPAAVLRARDFAQIARLAADCARLRDGG